jgi:dienelactone hydrolase
MKRRIHQRTLAERAVPGGRQLTLEFHGEGGPAVPATLLLPAREDPAPGALLIHGYSSRKEHMAEGVGRVLLRHRVASLAIDLPLHGTRQGAGARPAAGDALELMRHWRLAVRESRLAVHYLRARPEIDAGRVAVVGYSLGSFLATLLAAEERSIRALVVAAGGDLPAGIPLSALARTVVDPPRSIRKLAGRPLLVVHGTRDRTVLPEQAQRLYDAAGEPKEIRWWASGHYLPAAAIEHAAAWLEERLA